MPVRKNAEADLRRRYPIYVEIGMVGALALLIVAFRVQWSPRSGFEIAPVEQEQIEIEEVRQTQQIEQPPPPPKPPVPVEVPDDERLEDAPLDLDASLDLEAGPADAPPPPPPAEDSPEEEEPEIFVVVEEMPEPVGGMEAIYARANRYPEVARKAGVEGRVFVQFVVDEEGNVVDPVVTRGIGAGLDEVALEAVANTKFRPGRQRGKPVPVKMSLSIRFSLR